MYTVLWSVEASTLRLAPGEWPQEITFQHRHWAKDSVEVDNEGELIAVRYRCVEDPGLALDVWND